MIVAYTMMLFPISFTCITMMDSLGPFSPPSLLYPSANYISSIAKEIKERHVHRVKTHKEFKVRRGGNMNENLVQ